MATSIDCIFCLIVERRDDPPHQLVGESARALAFMNANPAASGHVLVIPKAHSDDIWMLRSQDGKEVFDLARQVAGAIKEALQPNGLNLFQANGKAGWQSVFHFHLHVVPRWFGDPLVPNWTEPMGERDQIPQTARAISASMESRGFD